MKNLSMMAKRRNKSCLFCFCLSYSYIIICWQKCPTSLSAFRIIEITKENGLSIHKNRHFDVYGDTICQFQLLFFTICTNKPVSVAFVLANIYMCRGKCLLDNQSLNNFKNQIDKNKQLLYHRKLTY